MIRVLSKLIIVVTLCASSSLSFRPINEKRYLGLPSTMTRRRVAITPCPQVAKNTSIVFSLRGGAGPAPKEWIGYALSCAFSYALYNLSIKKASSSIDHVLGGVFLQIVATMMGALLFIMKQLSGGSSSIITTKHGIVWSVIAGLGVGAAELLSFYVSSKGVQAMQSIPIIVGGSILFSTILGKLWLKEVITMKGWIGVVMIFLGITLVGSGG